MTAKLPRLRLPTAPRPEWCDCAAPLHDPDDDGTWCWRCARPIEARDADGRGLRRTEDEEDDA